LARRRLVEPTPAKDIPMPCRSLILSLLLALGSTAGLSAQSTREYINPRSPADGQGAPFSGAVLVDETLYMSGTLGREADGSVPTTTEREARLVLDNIRDVLEDADMTMDDLVFVQIFCSDVAHYDAFNAVYRTYFEREFPARAFIGSGDLLFGARFEVQAIAVRRPETAGS
jgi:reactive intermediate/imine deaminase